MDSGLLILISVFVGLPLVAFGYIRLADRLQRARRASVLKRDFPRQWIAILEGHFPLFKRLPLDEKRQLETNIKLFLAKTRFEGCGLELDDEIRVTIAAQACLLLLGRSGKPLYPNLKSVLVYPTSFKGGRKGIFGTDLDSETIRLGESWQSGTVILAWDSTRGGSLNEFDGKNVVIHEFAHQLDQEDGDGDGCPLLGDRSAYTAWAKVMGDEYAVHARKALKGKRSVIHRYGATNPAEFFATATEAFFEKPKQLHRKRPEVYRILKSYYQLDPLSWA